MVTGICSIELGVCPIAEQAWSTDMYLSEHCCCEDDEMVSLAVSSAHIIAPFLAFLSPRYDISP